MPVKRSFLLFAVLAALALAAYGLSRDLQKMKPVAPAPVAFYDKYGKQKTLADYKGKIVLVNLWASWCTPCLEELPSLEKLQKAFPADKFILLPIALDANTSMKDIQRFLKGRGLKNLDAYWDKDQQFPLQWKYRGLPTSFLLDREGRVIKEYEGSYDWNKNWPRKEIESLVLYSGGP